MDLEERKQCILRNLSHRARGINFYATTAGINDIHESMEAINELIHERKICAWAKRIVDVTGRAHHFTDYKIREACE